MLDLECTLYVYTETWVHERMTTLNVRQARERISRLLDQVARGEEVIITRRGKPAARLVGLAAKTTRFPDRRSLREALPPMTESAGQMTRTLREDERF